MIDTELLRYTCQMSLPGFGETGQRKLKNSKVLIIGAGGLGCSAAMYLAAAGVGTLGIADDNVVSVTNLHRQVLYNTLDIGEKKVNIAAARLAKQNPSIKAIAHEIRVTSFSVMSLIRHYDIILDCTDNVETRYLINDACVMTKKPLVYGAINQYEGQIAVWNVTAEDGSASPNYRDLTSQADVSQMDNGVLPTLTGIIGSLQANEAIKYITNTGELLTGKILTFNAFNLQSSIVKVGDVTQSKIEQLPETILIPELTVEEVLNGLADNMLELVDIRTDEERDQVSIGGTHIENIDLKDHLEYLKAGKTKVLFCSSGKRSKESVKLLKGLLPDTMIYNLQGGLNTWMERVPLDVHIAD